MNKIISPIFRTVLCPTMYSIGRKRDNYIYTYDYIRHSSLELVANEINNRKLKGSVAELGVFQGEFAKNINIAFPDRKLYLFDTFEGFNEKDLEIERTRKYSHSQKKDFSGTSIEKVMQKMKYPDNCIIKKGYFPATTEDVDVEEKYIFVNIDVDLYEPIYEGLRYFYPRLEQGGYIFVHDYNGTEYRGVKEAVRKYAEEERITFFPLTDHPGTVVFMK
jgi:O-methyltransferase